MVAEHASWAGRIAPRAPAAKSSIPIRCSLSPLALVIERSGFEESYRLVLHLFHGHEQRMPVRHHEKIAHALDTRTLDADFPIIRRSKQSRKKWVVATAARYHA